ncbi:MAG TPA: hypothetical protein DCX03_02375 [Bacteroidales bacterium]|nr:hypothetical protein [Bacteroidales bacterium]
MKRFVFIFVASLVFFTAGQVFAASNLNSAALRIETGILNVLNNLGNTISSVAKETGEIGLNNEAAIRKLLQKNYNDGKPFVIDTTFIDNKGIMKFIEPAQYRSYEGSDISRQETVIKMMKTKKPRMGNLFLSVEGIKSVDIEHPVFAKNWQFIGSVSMLVKPDEVIRSVAASIEKELGVNCWVMQKDGLIIYDTATDQIGLNLISDPLYKDYPQAISLAKRMVKEKTGRGFYSFYALGTKKVVKKQAVWKTIHFFNNNWIVVAYSEIK